MRGLELAITGMGAVTAYGYGVERFWSNIINGNYAISPLRLFDTSRLQFRQAGQIPEELFVDSGEHRCTVIAQLACKEAIEDARVPKDSDNNIVIFGTNFGDLDIVSSMLKDGKQLNIAKLDFQNLALQIVNRLQIKGQVYVLSMSCSSGVGVLCFAKELLTKFPQKRVIACGFDVISALSWSGLSALRTMTDELIRPFDKNRRGTIFSEGAGAVVIESYKSAEARACNIYAILKGTASTNNAYHFTAPDKDGRGLRVCMELALQDAGVLPQQIDYINAHGTGTRYNDLVETIAIKRLFGGHAYRLSVSSIKSAIGHCMGAAGILESIATVKAINESIVPPTINYQTPDPECDLDYTVNAPKRIEIKYALNNSSGIGGCNCCAVFGKP